MALELAPHSIRVNAIGPGPTLTGLTRANYSDPERRRATIAQIPLGRMGQPEDICPRDPLSRLRRVPPGYREHGHGRWRLSRAVREGHDNNVTRRIPCRLAMAGSAFADSSHERADDGGPPCTGRARNGSIGGLTLEPDRRRSGRMRVGSARVATEVNQQAGKSASLGVRLRSVWTDLVVKGAAWSVMAASRAGDRCGPRRRGR